MPIPPVPSANPLFFMVACEPSGDLLGARLIHALRHAHPAARFVGVGGERMVAAGLETLFPQAELAVFGLFELLPKIPRILARLQQTAEAVLRLNPAAVITIDGQDFSARLAKKIHHSPIPHIHYVAPTVWAWRPGRAKKIARLYHHLLTLFPFEPPYFEKEQLPTTFVGHAVIETGADQGDAARFRHTHGLGPDQPILCVLPGSRRSEIKRLAPVFGQTLALLNIPNLVVVVPAVAQTLAFLQPFLAAWPLKPLVITQDCEKYDAFAASRVALAASGTVSLELGLAGLRHAIAYQLNPLTVLAYRHLIKVKYANLINLLHDQPIVPELLQQDCTPVKLAETIHRLWQDEALRSRQHQAFAAMRAMLSAGTVLPSVKAAQTIEAVRLNFPRNQPLLASS